jgi:tRNA A-37 threonylcarbamoyl transferase component Bud32
MSLPDLPREFVEALSARYEVLGLLGRGAASTVHVARDRKHDRQVALKVLHPDLAAVIGVQRFLREIQVVSRLHHPHIVPLLDSGEAAGRLYYTMPVVEGSSLAERLAREGELPISEALEITRQVADALGYAQEKGVVHRDIKPSNIMLQGGHALVTDFGIASVVGDVEEERLTQRGLAVGTPAYMSPEQFTGEVEVDGRTDVYALASVLYEMLVGEPPFTGPSARAIIARRLSESLPSIRVVRNEVPDHVERAISRALSTSRTDRFTTPGAFAAALDDPTLTVDWTGETGAGRRTGRFRVATGAAALAAVVLAAVPLVGLISRRPPPFAEPPRQVTFDGNVAAPVVSPDGMSVAYVTSNGIRVRSGETLRIVDVAGGAGVEVAKGIVHRAAWSADGGTLMYHNRQGGQGSGIYLVSRFGTDKRRIVSTEGWPMLGAPAYAFADSLYLIGNGHWLYTGTDPSSIRWVGADSMVANGRVLDLGPGVFIHPGGAVPAMSPNGRWLAFASGGEGDIVVVAVDGSGETGRLVDVAHWAANAPPVFWSAGSDALYWLRGTCDAPGLSLGRVPVDPATGRPGDTPETVWEGEARAEHLDFARQSQTAALTRGFPDSRLLVARVADPEEATVSVALRRSSHLYWPMPSPDGSMIAYSDVIGRCESTLHVMQLGPDMAFASSLAQVKVEGVAGKFAWSPAGDRVAFLTEWPDGSESLRMLDVPTGVVTDVDPAGWGRPSGATIHWSATGTEIAYYMPGDAGIRVRNLEDDSVRDIAVDGLDFQFVLSPAGDSVFVSLKGGAAGNWVADVSEGMLRRVPDSPGWLLTWGDGGVVTWRSDGVYERGPMTGVERKIATIPACDGAPNLALSRDLEVATCSENEMIQDLWIIRDANLP